MPNDYGNSILPRWLAKEVFETRLIDGMESLGTWILVNTGQAKGQMTLTKERSVEGASSVRLRCPTTGDRPIPTERFYGGASAMRVVDGENWSDFNRLSFWIYPDLPGFRIVSLLVTFHNDGAEKVPDVYNKMGKNYLILRNHEWNHVVWEIANLPRDKVTGLEFQYLMEGNEPGATSIAQFDFDKLELQKVKADHFEGWNVESGEIAFSHSGYQTGASKSAVASDLKAAEFQVIDHQTGMPVLTKPVRITKTEIGRFQVLDFSEVQKPGTYLLRAGEKTTRPFRIGDDVWKSSLWKAINFFYVERCGFAIPGVHDICHRDWVVTHGDKKIIANGGWHDAGDLSQSFGNTAEATYAMFSLAERLEARGEELAVANRLIEEAVWGLHWLLKTSSGDGFRPTFSTMDRWTNGILGDVDDMTAQAGNSPAGNFMAATAEAAAARLLRSRDPILAGYSLKQAELDWGFAVEGMGSPSRRGSATELAGHAILAAMELWQTTGERQYADKAVEWSRIILDSQQREYLPGLTYPLTGFFYTGPEKERILRYSHLSHEAAPVVALIRLCEAFPKHPDWIRWYSAVTLYSDYQKAMAVFTQPWGMLANSLHKDDEYLKPTGMGSGVTGESYKAQVLNGVKVGDRYYVRRFPVWFEFRGNHGTVLTQTKAISAAAHLRGNLDLISLSERQAEWVMGRNPFVQSTMWGEGYNYAPQYTAMSGDIVGSLPVGIHSRGDGDAPYWPAENCHNWKEVWVVPVLRWFWLMRDLAGPALVEGQAGAGVRQIELRDVETGRIERIAADPASGRFRGMVPQGRYTIAANGEKKSLVLLPAGSYTVDLRPGRTVDIQVSSKTAADGTVTITATVSGSGAHRLAVLADNLAVTQPERKTELAAGTPQSIVWKAKMISVQAPWVTVVYPGGDLSPRVEAAGSTKGHPIAN
ncbi:MAG: glycoside hydrolase family 9 protein [Rhodospirillales bacterium]